MFGLLNLSFWGYVITTFAITHITIISVTLYLHRCQAHRAIELHPAVSHFFRLWLWLTTGMETKAWTAIHRKHHAHCEKEEDPHSPQILGLPKVLWQGAELYRKESINEATLEKFGKGTPDDWLEKNVYRKYSAKGILITLALDLILLGIPGLTIWAIQMMWIPFFAAGVINGIGHFWGYRNFECPDASTNIVPWGILVGGEELHNNHHTFGTSAKFSVKWWEFDLGWLYIKLLATFKLAKVRHLPPTLNTQANKTHIDTETVKALFYNRFQVMATYTKTVVLPTLKAEKRTSGLMQRAKHVLTRSEKLLNDTEKAKLETVLSNSSTLNLVYEYRQSLQGVWERTACSQQELLEALQTWCKQAEATGVEALKRFAQNIRHYGYQLHSQKG